MSIKKITYKPKKKKEYWTSLPSESKEKKRKEEEVGNACLVNQKTRGGRQCSGGKKKCKEKQRG